MSGNGGELGLFKAAVTAQLGRQSSKTAMTVHGENRQAGRESGQRTGLERARMISDSKMSLQTDHRLRRRIPWAAGGHSAPMKDF